MIGSQVTVGTTPTLVMAADDMNRTVLFHVVGNSIVYLGGSDVATSTGFYIDKDAGPVRIELPPKRTLYAIVSTGTEVVTTLAPEI